MIALSEIKKALVKKLGAAMPDVSIVTEDVSQSTDAELSRLFPLLHVQLNPIGSSPGAGGRTLDRVILVDITYMDDSISTNEAIYQMQDRLQAALGFYIVVQDRSLKIEQFNWTIADDLMHLTFQLEFNDVLPWDEETHELFGELKMDNITGGI